MTAADRLAEAADAMIRLHIGVENVLSSAERRVLDDLINALAAYRATPALTVTEEDVEACADAAAIAHEDKYFSVYSHRWKGVARAALDEFVKRKGGGE